MDILSYEQGFGAEDVTSQAMQKATQNWFRLYYRDKEENGEDPCQRIAYTVVSKLVRWVFAEYNAQGDSDFAKEILKGLDRQKVLAVQLALVGGESYLKPVRSGKSFSFVCIPRNRILVFARNEKGEPTDVGTVETSCENGFYFTLLERRRVDEQGYLTVENRLYRSKYPGSLGTEIPLTSRPGYQDFLPRYTFRKPVGSVGLVRLKTPQLNCVDGSWEGVSVYAPAEGLIHAIDRNEYLLGQEFEAGRNLLVINITEPETGTEYQLRPELRQDNTYEITAKLSGFAYDRSYSLSLFIWDEVTEIEKTVQLLPGVPVFDWGEGDFRFHVPVYMPKLYVDEKEVNT